MVISTRQLAQHERVKTIRLAARDTKPRTCRRELISVQRQNPQPRVQQPLDQLPVRTLDRDQRHLEPQKLAAQRPQPRLVVANVLASSSSPASSQTCTSCFSAAQSMPA